MTVSDKPYEVVAALVTPCRAAGEIDPPAMTRLSRALVEHGCTGLFVASSSGESTLLGESDRRALTVAVRAGVPAETRVYAGVSALGLRSTIEQARHAAADGADFAVVMAPFFFKIDQHQVRAYCSAIADESPLPVVLYHHPRMATAIEVDTVARLAEHPNIVGIKDTSADMDRVRALVEATAGTGLTMLEGSELVLLESRQLGMHGSVTALAGVMPEWHADLYTALAAGDLETASMRQSQILQLWKMFRFDAVSRSISAFSHSLKLGMRRRGWLDGLDDMVPAFVPDAAFEQQVDEHLASAGVPIGQAARDISRAHH